jgi:hypothetical protein
MATNFPGPYEMRFFYTSDGRSHVHRVNVQVSGTPVPGTDDFTTIDILLRDTSVDLASDIADAWVALWKPFLPSSGGSISRVELWKFTAGTFISTFVASYDIGVAGTGAGAVVPASQMIFVFRTAEGGIMKLSFLDTTNTPGLPVVPPYGGANDALADFVLAPASPFLARDTSFPIANIALYPGQNEALFKKIYRA